MKALVLEGIGETGLQHHAQINAALGANDRLKYYFSLMQMAIAHAEHPQQHSSTLRSERLACGIDDRGWDDVISGTRREDGGYRLPGCAKLLEQIRQDLGTMAMPVLAGENQIASNDGFQKRLERLISAVPKPQDDLIEAGAVNAITHAVPGKGDSIHQLVMDLHKALNALQAELAEERLDGAAVYGIPTATGP